MRRKLLALATGSLAALTATALWPQPFAHAAQFNSNDGATYLTADSAFRVYWNATTDKIVMQYASVGANAGDAITWNDGLSLSSAGAVSILGASSFTGNITLPATGTGTSGTQYPSYSLVFQGSGWDTTAAATVQQSLKLIPGSGATVPYRLALLNNGGTEYVTFDGVNQRVGIGTASPASPLDVLGTVSFGPVTASSDRARLSVSSNTATLGFQTYTGAGLSYDASGFVNIFSGINGITLDSNHPNGVVKVRINAVEAMRVTTGGAVGIGTTSPSTLMHLVGTTSPTQRIEGYNAGAVVTYPALSFWTNNNQENIEVSRIESQGYLGTNNQLKFHVTNGSGTLRNMWSMDTGGNLTQNPGGVGGLLADGSGIVLDGMNTSSGGHSATVPGYRMIKVAQQGTIGTLHQDVAWSNTVLSWAL